MSRSGRVLMNLSRGEVAPDLDGRMDLAQTAASCRVLRNMRVDVLGGVTRRRGTQYIAARGGSATVDVPIAIDLSINGRVWDLAPDGSGGFVFGGEFSLVGGVSHVRMARVQADGTVDHSFSPNFGSGTIYWIIRLASGQYLVGGTFLVVNGVTRNRIARLNADGTLDSLYDPNADQSVGRAVLQDDGKLVVVGGFSTIGGASRSRIARLNADGTNDGSYAAQNPTSSVIGACAYPGGRVLVWGAFGEINGAVKSGMAVLNTDGTTYTTFANTVTGINLMRRGAVAAADGSVFVTGGYNTTYADSEHTFKLNPNGSHATGFVVDHGTGGFGYGIAIDGSGNILIGGFFTSHNGILRNYISRCSPTTGVNDSFDPNANFDVYVIVPESGGTYLVGGNFTTIGGASRQRFTRLNNDGTIVT